MCWRKKHICVGRKYVLEEKANMCWKKNQHRWDSLIIGSCKENRKWKKLNSGEPPCVNCSLPLRPCSPSASNTTIVEREACKITVNNKSRTQPRPHTPTSKPPNPKIQTKNLNPQNVGRQRRTSPPREKIEDQNPPCWGHRMVRNLAEIRRNCGTHQWVRKRRSGPTVVPRSQGQPPPP